MYGNIMPDDPSITRMYPYVMSKIVDYFSFTDSRFSVSKSKEKTARISLFRELNIPLIYTMEASFWGADQGELKDMHFNNQHFQAVGEALFKALILYWKIDPYEVIHGHKQVKEQNEEVDKEKTYPPKPTATDENLWTVSSYEKMNGIVFNPRSGGSLNLITLAVLHTRRDLRSVKPYPPQHILVRL